MRTFATRLVVTTLAARGVIAVPAQAQVVNPVYQVPFGVNPYFQVRPGLTLLQAQYNIAAMGQALSNVPPYALGYNPYPRPIYYGQPYMGGGYNPYNSAPYANPYMPYANPS